MIKKMRAKLNEKKGFTLAELLIVVAIIAVLVAIAIPIFTAQLEKAREATDAANIRAAYAEVVAEALTQTTSASVTRTVTLQQKQDNWQTSPAPNLAGGGQISGGSHVDASTEGTPKASGSCTVTYTPGSGTGTPATADTVKIAFSN
ncbi:competence type IV pilus major pilin ComGC [Butyrivibrio sp. LC3010]|uniref:competence type IV pilus major pilin ComGC n=1 Tax=Butyrivibrio sp. LC3010 TaxID=1280680 RepID=UPI0003FB14A4|nr:prepilin-type N-terminal cleavage/methylation domain-containing protein [Butyrivibrio sp. LC3010]